ncbi:hypothetical protein OF83DRAFT_1162652 [Amylostereum chailletii]|nr:hypothetical protein OF83DRAFT_1162652 [Amylostereum chailletii]
MATNLTVDASEHPITSATVFKSAKAEISRSFTVTLQAGENKVEIIRLPSAIDIESARVTGLGNAQLFDVVCTVGGGHNDYSPDSSEELIRTLITQKSALELKRKSIDTAGAIMTDYSRSLTGEHVPPKDAESFIQKYVHNSNTFIDTMVELDEEILHLRRKIERLTFEAALKKGKTDGKVTAVVMAKQPTEVKLKLTYLVRHASWSPVYELHSTTESGTPSSSVSLQYRARITQSTGEDWSAVALTLSAAEMSFADQTIPELKVIRIRPPPLQFKPVFTQPKPASTVGGGTLFGASSSSTAFAGGGLFGQAGPSFGASQPQQAEPVEAEEEWDDTDGNGPSALTESTSIVQESPLSVSYRVEGESSIPSDGIAHKVSVAELPFEATVAYVVVPKANPVTFLQANVKNTSDYRLLPGPVNVYLDGSFVSKTSIKDITPGDAFDCTLGPDAGTRIKYTRVSTLEHAPASTFTERFNTTTYTNRTVIHNGHGFALDTLLVRDSVPLSDDEKRVRVILRRPEVLAEAKDGEEKNVPDGEGGHQTIRWYKSEDGKGGEKEGLYEWVCAMPAGKKIVLETQWDVKAPVDVRWVETSQ